MDGVPSNLKAGYGVLNVPCREDIPGTPGSLWKYRFALPCRSNAPVSMGEGLTPVIAIEGFGHGEIHMKDESRNPTASFKDRLATVAISWIRAEGTPVIGVSSTGNAGAAAAAYAARAGLDCVILTSRTTPAALLAQMHSYGAMVVILPTIGDRWTVLSRAAEELGWVPTAPFFGPAVGSHPVGIEGYKTIAYELAEQFQWNPPDWCILPVCYGDALFGMWRGFSEMQDWGWIDRCPRLVAAEVSGSLTAALERKSEMPPRLPRNHASIANSIDVSQGTYQALHALHHSNGLAVTLDDEDLVNAQETLATRCGVSAELASTAGFAAADRLANANVIGTGDRVAVVMTASGMKDFGLPGSHQPDIPEAEPDLENVLRVLEDSYGLRI